MCSKTLLILFLFTSVLARMPFFIRTTDTLQWRAISNFHRYAYNTSRFSEKSHDIKIKFINDIKQVTNCLLPKIDLDLQQLFLLLHP